MNHSTSSRRRPKTSRILLGVLAVTVAVGIYTFVKQYKQQSAVAGNAPAPATPAGASPDAASALVTQTPASATTIPTTVTNTSETKAPATSTLTAKTGAKPQAGFGELSRAAVPTVALSSKPLQDAKAKVDAGKPLEARDIYNAAIVSEKIPADQLRAAKQELAALNEKLIFSNQKFPEDTWTSTFEVPPGGVLAKIAKRFDVTAELLCRVNNISDPKRLQAGQKIKILKGPLHAVVDKSDFTMDLYFGAPGGEGSSYITSYRVGLGKDDSTPTGKWLVESGKKLSNPTYYSPPERGGGVIDRDDPKNPLGEHWIGLTGVDGQALGKTSYGIHGTIEPESIGTMASMGCIRLKNEDVARVYEMLIEGKSTVRVVD